VRQLESRLTPSLTTLASFAANGAVPFASLIMDGSGNLYGTTTQGGASNNGTVFEVVHSNGKLTTLASFNGTTGAIPNGSFPYAGMVMDGGGNLYGTTYGGGASSDGSIFELAAGSGTITTLASFDGADGANPEGGLILDSAGNLYGTTSSGGTNGDGTIFEMAKGSGTITTLASFDGADGANPQGGLIADSAGNLYGTTSSGGASSDGTVFEMTKGSGTITTLASFDGTNGREPCGAPVMDGSGNLYGATFNGGASGVGTVFELAHGSGTITTLVSFNGTTEGAAPSAVIMDGSGNLYGSTFGGGASGDGGNGTVFEVAAGSGTITTLASLNGTDGGGPSAVIMDSSGNLYGTAFIGGVPGNGTVFELAAGSGTITTRASFLAPHGSYPQSGLILDSSGNLYGTTSAGGAHNDGTVFELANGSSNLTTLASFNGSTYGATVNGVFPYSSLVMDSSGNLYGTTYAGGASSDGTVFELAKGSDKVTTLFSFTGTNGAFPDGAYPDAPLILDSNGNLYGTTSAGGASDAGTVFELSLGTHTLTTLAAFTGINGGGPGGSGPAGSLAMDSSGNLYGTTILGGASSSGTVFELASGSSTITTLGSFNASTGTRPYAGVVMDSGGNLYGTTYYGGAYGDGTVFELAAGSGTISTLTSFNGADGQKPFTAGLIVDSAGNLYGTTSSGGASHDGTVFELFNGSGALTTLATFNGTNGANPVAGLVMDSGGLLYGTTAGGGAPGGGTVFEVPGVVVPPDQWTGANFTVDTNWSDGANWSLGVPPIPGQAAVFTNNASVKSFTSTVDAGFTHAIGGLDIDSSWGGTITVNSPLAVSGQLRMASGTFGGSGAVTIGGTTSQWTGGHIDLGSGGFTNTGILAVDTSGGNLVLAGAGTLTNTGTMSEAGKNSVELENGAVLSNAAGATFDVTDDGGISQSGGGTLTNAGTLEKTGGTGASALATTSLGNTGTVVVTTGTLDIPAAVAQVSGATLTAGAWTVSGGSTLDITSAGSLTTLGAGMQITLDGANATFTNLRGLRAIDKGAGLNLLGGASLTTRAALTDRGAVTLGPASTLTVSGSFTEASTGALAVTSTSQVVSTTGTVTLAGALEFTVGLVRVGSAFELLDNEGNSAISGTFGGLPEGATFKVKVHTILGWRTMTFQVTYVGTDTDGSNNVLVTRIK
jgi:uncharacterized repeat protein (TIGR03803 family)